MIKQTSPKSSGLISLVFFTIILLLPSCKEWEMPNDLVGIWKSTQEVTVRYKEKGKPFQFISQSVEINIRIKADGTMEGAVGGANLAGYKIIKNRSWFGKLFNIATDYHIKGKIIGRVFETDPVLEKEFQFPFNMDDDILTGTIYQKQGIGISPMVDVRLKKE